MERRYDLRKIAVYHEEEDVGPHDAIQILIEEIHRLREVIHFSHEYIRDALLLGENAPLRFDYYAKEIEQLRIISSAFQKRDTLQ